MAPAASLLAVLPLSVVEIVADFALERYAHRGSQGALLLGVFGYVAMAWLLVRSMAGGAGILLINNLWDGVSTLLESAAAYLVLGERFERRRQYAGAALIVAGVFLVKP